jgi:hypothetical protein
MRFGCVTLVVSALKGNFGDIAAKDDSQVRQENMQKSACTDASFMRLGLHVLRCDILL